ncbi:MAG: cytochrome C biogenesis protein [bacterium]|jgi:cytochrome c-type biogenesis protein|nr:cytochrome C biogenesis protein [bacterium]MBK7188555.1 cytochrome C biogenesis protein [bacterium]MBK7670426.1 cytochrome C biogenesis protein [bacterium]MBK7772435.1 cytochrome C biogenesis protein [bacterium]MBK9471090.1 cytochrome C biogenesis protein [bacterium]
MQHLFENLTVAVSGSAPIALLAAFTWGVLSILLSPCHLASIPLIVGFIQGQGQPSHRRALALSTLFAVGILVTIALIGVVTAGLGRLAGDIGSIGNVAVAVIFIFVGLVMLDLVPLALPAPARVGLQRRGAFAALLLGLVFGIALGPCTFAYMAPMLAVTFKVATTRAAYGAALLLAFGLGHCLVIAIAGAGSAWVQRTLDWNAESRTGAIIKKACGALVVLGGMYLLYTAH